MTTVAPARPNTRVMPPPMPAPPPVTSATLPSRRMLSLPALLGIEALPQEAHGSLLDPVAIQLSLGDAPLAVFAHIAVVVVQRPGVVGELAVVVLDMVGEASDDAGGVLGVGFVDDLSHDGVHGGVVLLQTEDGLADGLASLAL